MGEGQVINGIKRLFEYWRLLLIFLGFPILTHIIFLILVGIPIKLGIDGVTLAFIEITSLLLLTQVAIVTLLFFLKQCIVVILHFRLISRLKPKRKTLTRSERIVLDFNGLSEMRQQLNKLVPDFVIIYLSAPLSLLTIGIFFGPSIPILMIFLSSTILLLYVGSILSILDEVPPLLEEIKQLNDSEWTELRSSFDRSPDTITDETGNSQSFIRDTYRFLGLSLSPSLASRYPYLLISFACFSALFLADSMANRARNSDLLLVSSSDGAVYCSRLIMRSAEFMFLAHHDSGVVFILPNGAVTRISPNIADCSE